MKAPHSSWLPFLDRILATILLLSLYSLAKTIALGDVREVNSAGLDVLVGCFTTLSGGLWAFLAYRTIQDSRNKLTAPPEGEQPHD